MPKIIENLNEIILTEAKTELFEKGYNNMTMRSVACACHIAVGTLYNYFDSKDVLIAEIMLQDWKEIMDEVRKQCKLSEDIFDGFKIMYDGVSQFCNRYDSIWTQYGKSLSIKKDMPVQFDRLITELSSILDEILVRCHNENDKYISVFLSEILLSAAAKNDFEYDKLQGVLRRMFTQK